MTRQGTLRRMQSSDLDELTGISVDEFARRTQPQPPDCRPHGRRGGGEIRKGAPAAHHPRVGTCESARECLLLKSEQSNHRDPDAQRSMREYAVGRGGIRLTLVTNASWAWLRRGCGPGRPALVPLRSWGLYPRRKRPMACAPGSSVRTPPVSGARSRGPHPRGRAAPVRRRGPLRSGQ